LIFASRPADDNRGGEYFGTNTILPSQKIPMSIIKIWFYISLENISMLRKTFFFKKKNNKNKNEKIPDELFTLAFPLENTQFSIHLSIMIFNSNEFTQSGIQVAPFPSKMEKLFFS
jgi:hypothetical protein